MKIVQITPTQKINIEYIYSLEKNIAYKGNENDIKEWNDSLHTLLEEYTKENKELYCIDKYWKPSDANGDFSMKNKYFTEYIRQLSELHISENGEKPELIETEYSYEVILSSGVRVNIDKNMYELIGKELDKYLY